MSPESQSELPLQIKTMKPGGYYWRLLGRELDDRGKLVEAIGYLTEEIKTHRELADRMGIWPDDIKCASEGVELLLDGKSPALQELVGVLVANLEAFCRCFRENDEWPPLEFEPHDIAKALLGYVRINQRKR